MSRFSAPKQYWERVLKGIINTHGLRYVDAASPAASYEGFRCAGAFVDDFHLQHPPHLTQSQAQEQYDSVLQLLTHLGFTFKPSKNINPARRSGRVHRLRHRLARADGHDWR